MYSLAFGKHSSPAAGREDDGSSERVVWAYKTRDGELRDDEILQLLKNMIRTALKMNS